MFVPERSLRLRKVYVGLVLAILYYHVGLGRVGLRLLEPLMVFIGSLKARF